MIMDLEVKKAALLMMENVSLHEVLDWVYQQGYKCAMSDRQQKIHEKLPNPPQGDK